MLAASLVVPRDSTRRWCDVTEARRVKHRACGLSALRVRTGRPRRRGPTIIAAASTGTEKQGTPDPASAPREFAGLLVSRWLGRRAEFLQNTDLYK